MFYISHKRVLNYAISEVDSSSMEEGKGRDKWMKQ